MKKRMAYDATNKTIVALYSNELQSEYNKNTTKENEQMAKKKKLLVSVDAGKKSTKVYYEIDEKQKSKVVKSCIDIVESGDDTFTHAGLTLVNDIPFNFNTSKSVIETAKENKKHNNYHLGLIVKELDEISEKEGFNTFDLALTTPLDGFNNMLKDIQEFYEAHKTLEIRKGDSKKVIKIDKIIIRPEMVSAINQIGATVKKGVVFVLDIGGLNHQYLKLDEFKTDLKDDSYIGERGYNYIEENLGQFMRNNSTKSYKDADIFRYIESDKFETDSEKDALIQKFFDDIYVPLLVEDLDKKSYSLEYDRVFLCGGTAQRFKNFLENSFKKKGATVQLVNKSIFASVIGAYKRAKADIAKLEKESK